MKDLRTQWQELNAALKTFKKDHDLVELQFSNFFGDIESEVYEASLEKAKEVAIDRYWRAESGYDGYTETFLVTRKDAIRLSTLEGSDLDPDDFE